MLIYALNNLVYLLTFKESIKYLSGIRADTPKLCAYQVKLIEGHDRGDSKNDYVLHKHQEAIVRVRVDPTPVELLLEYIERQRKHQCKKRNQHYKALGRVVELVV